MSRPTRAGVEEGRISGPDRDVALMLMFKEWVKIVPRAKKLRTSQSPDMHANCLGVLDFSNSGCAESGHT